MKISMLGTRGVPAQYGGFETAVEEIGARLVERGHDITVYCRNTQQELRTYRGMNLRNLPAIRLRSAETLSHTALSMIQVLQDRPDVALVFNMANSPLLPALSVSGIPAALHVDGMEWQRGKWEGLGRRYYKAAERFGVKFADALIADSGGIADYYRQRYRVSARKIAYGTEIRTLEVKGELPIAGVFARQYHLIVARWVPENNLDVLMSGYSKSSAQHPLLIVGDAAYDSPYAQQLRAIADQDHRIRLLGAIYDQDLLNTLYSGALSYLHGHSVGGTNPSLLRAMGSGVPVTAFDVVFNREVLGDTGTYFRHQQQVTRQVEMYESDVADGRARAVAAQERARSRYDWALVASQYESLCEDLMGLKRRGLIDYAQGFRVRRGSGRFARH